MASLGSRVMAAVKAGLNAFNAEELQPAFESAWGDRTKRIGRYDFMGGYVRQNPYKTSRDGAYQFRRNIVNPADVVVEFYTGQVYGGQIKDNLEGGAIPVLTENEALRPALMKLYKNSNWQSDKALFVRNGATYGDSAVKVVDDRQAQTVYLEVLHPGKIHTIERDSQGWITYARIEYEERVINPETGDADSVYVYREDITPDEFRTYKDDKPFAYFSDANGQQVDTWRNEYNFVPLEVTQHIDVGLGWGINTFRS